MSLHCQVFDVDVSNLTSEQIKERCSGCLEHTGGMRCSWMKENNTEQTGSLIERATVADATWIKQIYNQCKKELGSFNLFYCWDKYILNNEGNYLVIRPYAFVRYTHSRLYKSWVLQDIGVEKEARGNGYGLLLVKSVPTPMILKCNQDNKNGNEFYASIGMKLIGTTFTKNGKPQNVWQCVAW